MTFGHPTIRIPEHVVGSAGRKEGNSVGDEGKRSIWIREITDMGAGKHDWGLCEFTTTICWICLLPRKCAYFVPEPEIPIKYSLHIVIKTSTAFFLLVL